MWLQGNFEKPDQEEIEQTMKETAAALNLVVSNKLQAAQPKTVPKQPGAPTFIKYTPSQQGPQYASGSRERTIKMQDMPIDPMEPPKFRHKKVNSFARAFLQLACLLQNELAGAWAMLSRFLCCYHFPARIPSCMPLSRATDLLSTITVCTRLARKV